MSVSENIAQKLLQIKAIKLNPQNPFTWASGIKSPIYCDNRITLSFPAIRDEIKNGFALLAQQFDEFDYIAGVATAGIAHGALLADELKLPFVYVRAEAKSHGRQNKIEGHIQPGAKAIVIEDLISTGGSSIKACQVLQNEGVQIAGVLAIFNYQFDVAKNNFEKNNLPFATLSYYTTMVNLAKKTAYISTEEAVLLNHWNQDPENWFEKFFNVN